MPGQARSDNLKAWLRHTFGFEEFMPGQRQVIEEVLRGRDVPAVLPTGGGKSLCYQLPGAIREGVVLVISPLISVMKDQVDSPMTRERVPATCISSSLSQTECRRRFQEMLERAYRLVLQPHL